MSQYLNNRGMSGLIEHFYHITSKYHDPKQMKNKYDMLKKYYTSLQHLNNPAHGCTGLGWDNRLNTIFAPDHWWSNMINMNKHCAKFRDKGLQHLDLMEMVFGGLTSTGQGQSTPGEDFSNVDEVEVGNGENDTPSPTQSRVVFMPVIWTLKWEVLVMLQQVLVVIVGVRNKVQKF